MKSDDYPALHGAASLASLKGQSKYKRLIKADLAFVVAGGIVAAVASLVDDSLRVALATVTAIVVALGVVAKWVNSTRQDDRNWFNGRAVAETVKSLAWRYMMCHPPFEEQSRADREFFDALGAVRGLARDLDASELGDPSKRQQISARMRAVRDSTLLERRDTYVSERLSNQIEWYEKKAKQNREKAESWNSASLGFQVVALLAAIALVATPMGGLNLIGVLGSLAAAATAWSQLGRYDELSKSYVLAAQELRIVKDLAENVAIQGDLDDIVRDGEGAISREHTMWVAKRGESLPSQVLRKYGL